MLLILVGFFTSKFYLLVLIALILPTVVFLFIFYYPKQETPDKVALVYDRFIILRILAFVYFLLVLLALAFLSYLLNFHKSSTTNRLWCQKTKERGAPMDDPRQVPEPAEPPLPALPREEAQRPMRDLIE